MTAETSVAPAPTPHATETSARPIVEARSVDKTYDTGRVEVHALRAVDLAVPRGQMVAIMGPSGSGKTTLLNCLSGLDAIDGGDVLIDGSALSSMSDRERTDYRARHMGFVFQFYNLMPVLTAVENVELPLLVARVPAREARRRALEALALVGLEDRAGHVPDELSGGQRQRVTIARALVNDPALVWADEPTGDLDSENAAEVLALMRRLNLERGLTFLIVTHDPGIGRSTDRIVRMVDGRVVADELQRGEPVNELFGIPTGALATALAVLLAAGLGVVALLALRNPVLVRLGLRNIPRRRGRTLLIVVGLMLGTAIIAAALATGDTMSSTIRSYVVRSLGQTDELVSVRGTDVEPIAIARLGRVGSFDESAYGRIRAAVRGSALVDGVAPAVIEPVAVRDATSRRSEPSVTLFASDPQALGDFGPMRAGGRTVSLGDLRRGEVFVNSSAGDELAARAGDSLLVIAGSRAAAVRVAAVVDWDGAGTDGPAVLATLRAAQEFLGMPGRIDHVLISNRGGAVSGARLSDEVVRLLEPTLAPLGLEADAEKQEGLDFADRQGAGSMALFTTFGSFSIAAGILLIFLIFVMLAAERRGELGIARAIGTRRGHLVQTYLFEGVAYDLAAAAVGTLLGLGVAYGMVLAMGRALESFGIELAYDVRPQSIVLAYALGVLLTLAVVTVSAWRVSVLSIATAVRNLPEPPRRRRRGRWVLPALGVVLGVLAVAGGISAADAATFMLGVSLVLVSLAPIARALGARDRAAYTATGLALVVLWLLPSWVFDPIAEFAQGYTVFLIGGLMIVVGSTWVIMYNAELLLGALAATAGRVRALAPVLKLAMAYPLRSVFRTGVTLAMFTLVVFTLVVGTTISGSFTRATDDLALFGGGFEVHAVASPTSPIRDVKRAVPRAAGAVHLAAVQSTAPLDVRQAGAGSAFAAYPVNGLDDTFVRHTTYGFAAIADGYRTDADVWRALERRPGLAVVDTLVAPRRDGYNTGVRPDFQLSGFVVEDGRFAPVPVEVRDPQRGTTTRLTVIAVLKDATPALMTGISTSQRTLAGIVGERARPAGYWLALRPGADAEATAGRIESAFLANGVEAEALQQTLDDSVAASRTFNSIVEGFMGLGLVVGVAALGVISARAVVERRQQIGVLRSLGFQRRMIEAVFLLESSFVALTAIVVGTALGLAISYNVISDQAQQPSWETLTFTVPWLGLGLIFAVVYAVALLTTLVPAIRASRVYPAQALRYQ